MGLWSIPGTGHVRVALVETCAPLEAARNKATEVLAAKVYQRRDIVGPGKEPWPEALRKWTPEASTAMGLARAAVVLYEQGVRFNKPGNEVDAG